MNLPGEALPVVLIMTRLARSHDIQRRVRRDTSGHAADGVTSAGVPWALAGLGS
jgi:hypothetical protein